MLSVRRIATATGLLMLAAAAERADAQLWNPLDTVPKPNVVLGQDTSVTMAIDTTCTGCHLGGDPSTRLNIARTDLLATIPLVKDYFVFGAFTYEACGFAKITNRVLPNIADPDVSYAASVDLLRNAQTCSGAETLLPGGVAPTGCLTPTDNCSGDLTVMEALLNGQLPGLAPLAPFKPAPVGVSSPIISVAHFGGGGGGPPPPPPPPACTDGPSCAAVDVPCDDGTSYLIEAAFIDKVKRVSWPRWTAAQLYEQDVDGFCNKLLPVYDEINNELAACSASAPVLVDYSARADWCNARQIVSSACSAGSLLEPTCVCDASDPRCQAGNGMSACGIPLIFKARQQVAVCETDDRSAPDRFGSVWQSQPDNMVNGGCRENAAVFLTDGYMGGSTGTLAQIQDVRSTFSSAGGLNNMAVFHVSNVFGADADAMMNAMSNGLIPQAYSATDALAMQSSFARIVNRIYKGVYTGTTPGSDHFGSRVAYHAFTVVGHNPSGPVSEDYFGWPGRISWHHVDPSGAVEPTPVWETDWLNKVQGPPVCPRYVLGQTFPLLGPGGQFRNGVARDVTIPADTLDRNGDGVSDPHPPLRLGSMYSIAATRPIVVEAPRDPPSSQFAADFWQFAGRASVRQRPEMVYVMSNGYLHGIGAGEYRATPTSYGQQDLAFSYDDSTPSSGVEVFRYGPSWADDATGHFDYAVNDLIQQPVITGQLFASDQRIRTVNGDEYRTVLVGTQGKSGPGMFSLDVSDPCQTTVLAEWKLPGAQDTASGDPAVYTLPVSTAPEARASVVMTGGLGGTSAIYAFDVASGALLFQGALPAVAGHSYPTAPICVDATGEGHVTHCYALRDDGLLARAKVDRDAFTDIRDITPPGIVGGGRVFSTAPSVFFGTTGAVNLVFGSGDYQRLTTPGGQNYIYKVIDEGARLPALAAGPADVSHTCRGSSPSGVIALPAGERVISPPIIAKGVVAWATYRATSSGCVAGTSRLYAMDFDSCADAIGNGDRPSGVDVHEGLPAAPLLHRGSERLLVSTSAGPTGAQTEVVAVRTRGGRVPLAQKVFWRLESDVR